MKSEIITIGSEILLGDIIDTNSSYISKELATLGVNVFFHSTVGDNKLRLEETIKTALKRSDLIILTGGLGPTEDDITKETISKSISKKLIESSQLKNSLIKKLKEKGQNLTKNNLKQCLIFEDSKIFENENGTAPGLAIKYNNQTIIVLPGPPKELALMFEKSVKPYIKNMISNSIIKSKNVLIYGISEASVDEKISDILAQKNPSVGIYAKTSEVRLRITGKFENEEICLKKIDAVVNEIKKRLGSYIYGIDVENMETALIKTLIKANKKIAVAESCTGGLIASKIVSVPKASKVFNCGLVCYSNEIKQSVLNVKKETIDTFCVISKEVAKEMAENVLKISDADISISTTGLAGPLSENETKPIGLIYIGISTKEKTTVKKLHFKISGPNSRNKIINLATLFALNEARLAALN